MMFRSGDSVNLTRKQLRLSDELGEGASSRSNGQPRAKRARSASAKDSGSVPPGPAARAAFEATELLPARPALRGVPNAGRTMSVRN